MSTHAGTARKRTGGRKRPHRDRRKHESGREAAETTIGAPRMKVIDTRGGSQKIRALATDTAYIARGDETTETTIEDVVENDANPNYVRRNIVTKGAIIETPEGRARVTSRPGQSGQVFAVAIDD